MIKKRLLIIGTAIALIVGVVVWWKMEADRNAKLKAELKDIITNKNWCYSDVGDTNYIYFRVDGDYGYWCACGNGVDGHDVFEKYEFTSNPKKIKVKGSGRSEMIEIFSYSDKHLILNVGGRAVGFELEEDYAWTYPKRPVSPFVVDYTGIYEVLVMDEDHIEFTVPGEKLKEPIGELPVSKDVEFVEFIAETPSAEIYEETQASNLKREDISKEDVSEYVKDPDMMEIIFCNDKGIVEKIIFYKLVDEDGKAIRQKTNIR